MITKEQFNIEQIAKIAHEANRVYCSTIGDLSQKAWEESPDWQKESARKGVEFHIEQYTKGIKPAPNASHNSWLEEKKRDGWKYGPVKDVEKKEHPCYIPYDNLPLSQQIKDYLFGAVVSAFVEAHR